MSRLKEWRALDHCDTTGGDNATIEKDSDQLAKTQQVSDEWIIIKDSEKVNVTTTDTQAAISLQAGIQVAIAIVLNITIADSNRAEQVFDDLKQVIKTRQANRQKTIVEKSVNVEITTQDTDVAINIQLLLQILVAIVLLLDVL
ncbi:spore coat protein [Oceanobacillus caeni]|uniref:spore coat protein n=1 Tax=Oceanobacillus TaxID=182709 RepID=UPI0006210E07|nr:spore coat protein [Oceanobacillus caeni]KKE78154.1 spore coat protein [Bacilli bacterium VT-13-104]PZD84779.1 spore coat protein [Bacilli bacterium]MBU8791633.1 spore coat protein [Oceanobacillus caeni]MCR1835053.1 spore coat protein [Oceanobacillus caeni]PZD86197.1 spore coat protein [Bacilli bacterium]